MGLSVAYTSAAVLLLITLAVSRVIWVLPFYRLNVAQGGGENVTDRSLLEELAVKNNGAPPAPLQTFVFLGSGGHTGEMLRLLQNFSGLLLKGGATLHIGYSDDQSLQKFQKLIGTHTDVHVHYYRFVKAREVGAGLGASVVSILRTLATSFAHVVRVKMAMMNKPHLVLLNGPGTCCIISLWCKILDVLLLCTSSNIVYVESLARISTLSLTGKILYWLADLFVVQWEELLPALPRAKYYGILV
ncbi:N-acetylglucosaminyldiphosphodolichol N-acetylglucosaminyltransferase anchoring subunit [Maudiozyma humilis]|uniref:UDP-N-acetylglucosamine transferase subunit ALG14 n=1 Tax=Maudiozyma humilis TaxID=51915 RepID=A0AAV5S3V2_MAUHU|nr:N-acetylglucosaminyldiphosphodolichol N-acetylglucosaminyltransferase anchoring subunit [Kazachstania humilis]